MNGCRPGFIIIHSIVFFLFFLFLKEMEKEFIVLLLHWNFNSCVDTWQVALKTEVSNINTCFYQYIAIAMLHEIYYNM